MRGLNRFLVLLGAFLVLLSVTLVACTTDAGYNPSAPYKDRSINYIVAGLENYSGKSYLPKCTENLNKKVFYVFDEAAAFICLENAWARIRYIDRNSPEVQGLPQYDPKSKDVSHLVNEEDYKMGSFTDPRDGHTYKTVIFNGQEWMAENLDFDAEGDTIFSDCSDLLGAKNCRLYSLIYGYYDEDFGGYPKNLDTLCPLDFKVPTMMQWDTLFSAVGYWDLAGKSLKSRDFVGEKGRRGEDIISFTVLPAGYYGDRYMNAGEYAGFASLNERSVLFNDYADAVYSVGILSGNYYSVRCVRRAR